MNSLYDGYRTVETENKTVFFAGANTENGFHGMYGDIADERTLDKLYIIKGGPGNGKSTFMRTVAEEGENAGENVEYYLCGSDPDSLDCVCIGRRFALLDGTPPHIAEPLYPAAVAEYIDLGRYWNVRRLEAISDEIKRLTDKKKQCYAASYRYLGAAAAVYPEIESLASKVFLREKAEKYISRFISRLPKPDKTKPEKIQRYSHAITMRGKVKTESVRRITDIGFRVSDSADTAPLFMELLADALCEKGYHVTVTLLPLCGIISGIFIKEKNLAVTVGEADECEKSINLARFVNTAAQREVRGEARLAGKVFASCTDKAAEYLTHAAECHFALEDIFIENTDFDKLAEYRRKKSREIVKKMLASEAKRK